MDSDLKVNAQPFLYTMSLILRERFFVMENSRNPLEVLLIRC